MEYKKQVNMPNTPLPDDATPEQKASWKPRIVVEVPLTDNEIIEYKQRIVDHEERQKIPPPPTLEERVKALESKLGIN